MTANDLRKAEDGPSGWVTVTYVGDAEKPLAWLLALAWLALALMAI